MESYFDPITKTRSKLETLIARASSFGRDTRDTVTIKTVIADICNHSQILLAAAQSDVRGRRISHELLRDAAKALTAARTLADKNGVEMSGLDCLELWRDQLQHSRGSFRVLDLLRISKQFLFGLPKCPLLKRKIIALFAVKQQQIT